MDADDKKAILKIAITSGLPFFLKTFLSGKTKLGVYILGIAWASAKYFFDVDLPTGVELPPEVVASSLPVPVKVGVGVGSGVLGIGVIHDLIKKFNLTTSKVMSIFRK